MNLEYFFNLGKRSNKLSEKIRDSLKNAKKIKIVSGFLSKSGFESILGRNSKEKQEFGEKIEYIIVGCLTVQCAELFDDLIKYPNYQKKIFVNLGIGRASLTYKKTLTRYLPMVHTKIIGIDYDSNQNTFYIGSSNITKFALEDFNAEAGVIIENLTEAESGEISNYMDSIKSLPSTKLYDVKQKEDLIYLTQLFTTDESDYLNNLYENIRTFLLVLCVSPTVDRNIFIPDNIIYSDITDNIKPEIRKFHESRGRYAIFIVFKNTSDLINLMFDRAEIVYSIIESFNPPNEVNRSIENRIDALINYHSYLVPYIDIMKKAPYKGPLNTCLQTKYRVVNKETVKIKNIHDYLKNSTTLNDFVKKLVIKKESKTQEFKPVSDSPIECTDGKYYEIAEFQRIGVIKTLEEVIHSFKNINSNTIGILDKKLNEILEDLKRGDEIVDYYISIQEKINYIYNKYSKDIDLLALINEKFLFKAICLIKIPNSN